MNFLGWSVTLNDIFKFLLEVSQVQGNSICRNAHSESMLRYEVICPHIRDLAYRLSTFVLFEVLLQY